ncbi:hypothetical protein BDN67DRAFT_976002 [Paxillus ammoniavirescens]|nr:hypothetical protein BDN67DRAFT_976002 [Paxillus ammoniavirescens]
MQEGTFQSKPRGEAKWFVVGRAEVKSTTHECKKSLALRCSQPAGRRRVQGIEFWDYYPTADGEIHKT